MSLLWIFGKLCAALTIVMCTIQVVKDARQGIWSEDRFLVIPVVVLGVFEVISIWR